MDRLPSSVQAPSTQAKGGISSQDPALVAMEFQVGERVSATILELLGEGKVLVGLRGIKVEAKTRLPLQEGKTYSFVVKEAGEKILLAPASKGKILPSIEAGLLARLLSRGGAAGFRAGLEALARLARAGKLPPPLAEAVEKFSQWPDTPPKGENLVQGLGLRHEARLLAAVRKGLPPPPDLGGDLKALLLGALPKGAGKGGRDEGFRAALAALEGLEGVQAENLHRARLGGGEMIPLPLVPGVKAGEIHLFPPVSGEEEKKEEAGGREGEGEGRPFRVVFLLDLERLGPLRVDAEILGKKLRVLFRTGSGEAEDLVRRNLPGLRESLAAAGLEPLSLEVRRAEREEALSLSLPAGPGLEPGRYVDVEG
ncbi:MAG TPA: flagellar hook-length control protein FliK [Planctomycetes bacterium]|nr:flagellar hook-length control protein FliK [Planctomycetota bacterium]